MAQDVLIKGEVLQVSGSINSDQGHISSDGVNGTLTTVGLTTTNQTLTTGTITTANLTNVIAGINGGSAGASVTTSGTINTSKLVSKVTTGSAVTAVIMGSGTTDGQLVLVEHVGAAASSITFATAGSAAASSHIATDYVFSGQKAALFVWEATTALWMPVAY
jgi:hypothetical protein